MKKIPQKYFHTLSFVYYALSSYEAKLLMPNLEEWLNTGLPFGNVILDTYTSTTNSKVIKKWADSSNEDINLTLEAIDWVDNNPEIDLSEYKSKKQTFEDVLLYNKILRAELKLLLELRKKQQ